MKEKIYKLLLIFSALGVLGVASLIMLFIYISFDLPDVKDLMEYSPPVPSQILSNDGVVLLTIGKEKRDLVEIKDVPKLLAGAFLAAEDNNFENHHGVDFAGMLRAMVVNVKAGRIVQGGSTITQQVAKLTLLSRERSFTRKIKDFLLAQRIEKVFSKDEILYFYLNHIYLGGGYYGVKSAFSGYFDKSLSEGTIAEFALIAGLIVAPGKYSPYLNPQYAKIRQNYVLGRMLDAKRITEDEYQKAINEPIKIRIRHSEPMLAPHFTDYIRQKSIEILGEEEFLTGGFKIVSTLDYELQKKAELHTLVGVKSLDKRQGFKGPLMSFTTEDEIDKFVSSEYKKLLEANSHYFYLTPEGEKNYENSFGENLYLELKKKKLAAVENNNNKHFWPGIDQSQNFELLKVGENYKALVEKVDDFQRIIYVSIGGISGIISYENFKWAHERNIDKNRHYYPYMQIPSKIVKKGDVIQVQILTAPKPVWEFLNSSFRDSVDKNSISLYKNEKYVVCSLEQEPDVDGSLVAINVLNNYVVSLVGGVNFEKSQFNRAIQAQRQTGSAFKPILFASALEHNYTPASIVFDSPEALGGSDETLKWKPSNYDNTFKGPMTVRRILELSRNVPSIKVAEDIGLSTLTKFMKRIGLKVEGEVDLSLALGSYGITLIDLVSTYSIFPSGGKKVVPTFIVSITDRNGKEYLPQAKTENEEHLTTEEGSSEDASGATVAKVENKNKFLKNLDENQVYDPRLAYIMSNLLRGVIMNGTGRRASDIGSYIGGKTGTTNDYIDAWFIGFSSNTAVGTWVGFDNNQTLGWPETGAMAALPFWKEYMRDVLKKYGDNEFKVPSGIVNVLINKDTGKLASTNDSNDMTIVESFVEGTAPGGEDTQVLEKDSDSGEKENKENEVYNDEDFYNYQ